MVNKLQETMIYSNYMQQTILSTNTLHISKLESHSVITKMQFIIIFDSNMNGNHLPLK